MRIIIAGRNLQPPWTIAPRVLAKNISEALSFSLGKQEIAEINLATTLRKRYIFGLEDEFTRFLSLFSNKVLMESRNSYSEAVDVAICIKRLLNLDTDNIIVHLIGSDLYNICLSSKILSRTRTLYTTFMPNPESISSMPLTEKFAKYLFYNFGPNGIHATSPKTAKAVEPFLINKKKLFQVYPPIDTNFFRVHTRCQQSKRQNTVLFLGSLEYARFPFDKVLYAIKILHTEYKRNIDLLIIVRNWPSNYLMKKQIESLAQKIGVNKNIRVILLDLNQNQKLAIYSKVSVLLQPFTRFVAADPPLSMLEAMSCEIPPVTTATQSMPYIIRNEVNGIIIKNLEPKSLAHSIAIAIEKRREFGIEARRTVEKNMSYSIIGNALLAIYEDLIG